MIHYTPLEKDEIFPPDEMDVQIVTYQGKSLSVLKNQQGEYQVLQLLSTNPQDFLNNSFMPGSTFKSDTIKGI